MHSCGCHSSRARHPHPKYIHPMTCLKLSHHCRHPAGRSSPVWCFACQADSCSRVQKCAGAAGSRHAWWSARSCPGQGCPHGRECTQCVFRLFICYLKDNRLIHYLIFYLLIFRLQACPAALSRRKSIFPSNLQSKRKALCLFPFHSEARDLGRIGKIVIVVAKRESWQSCEPQPVSVV